MINYHRGEWKCLGRFVCWFFYILSHHQKSSHRWSFYTVSTAAAILFGSSARAVLKRLAIVWRTPSARSGLEHPRPVLLWIRSIFKTRCVCGRSFNAQPRALRKSHWISNSWIFARMPLTFRLCFCRFCSGALHSRERNVDGQSDHQQLSS